MFTKITNKLRKIFNSAADKLPENATAAEIDNFLDDVLAAQENVDKNEQNNELTGKVKTIEETLTEIQATLESHGTLMTKMNDEFGKKLDDNKTALSGEIEKVTDELTTFKGDVKEDLKNLKIGKSKDVSEEEEGKAVGKNGKDDKDEKDGKRIVSAGFMSKHLGV